MWLLLLYGVHGADVASRSAVAAGRLEMLKLPLIGVREPDGVAFPSEPCAPHLSCHSPRLMSLSLKAAYMSSLELDLGVSPLAKVFAKAWLCVVRQAASQGLLPVGPDVCMATRLLTRRGSSERLAQ
mmetsp:Transcript_103707/g.309768  ORF Transcript_103707/g.309768 Transcript_103707/m.309768 type:complete len:127 (-) Transcript_103707:149-529(-)